MKYNCRQPISLLESLQSVFALGLCLPFNSLTVNSQRKSQESLCGAAEQSCQSPHSYTTASTHLSQGHVIMIPPCEWVSHAVGVYVCVKDGLTIMGICVSSERKLSFFFFKYLKFISV